MRGLVVYGATERPLRSSVTDHLYSFRRYAPGDWLYVNAAVAPVPRWLARGRFDIVVYHTTFLGLRWNRRRFPLLVRRLASLRDLSDTHVAIPQDEFIHTDLLNQFIELQRINHVFTIASEADQSTIYPKKSPQVKFTQVLTGYVESRSIKRTSRFARRGARPIDVSYRAWGALPSLGRIGYVKKTIADVLTTGASKHGLTYDISTNDKDTLLGDAWYALLGSSRWVGGVEGGSSILDVDGGIFKCATEYLTRSPSADFAEVEKHCFPGQDGRIHLSAISPRHFEAIGAMAGQILVEGRYDGVLQPWEHYLPLKSDFSNIDEVLDSARDERLRAQLTAAAYEEVLSNKRYSYEEFVRLVLSEVRSTNADTAPSGAGQEPSTRIWRTYEAFSWTWVGIRAKARDVFRRLVGRVSR
jgi:hypothetical protein